MTVTQAPGAPAPTLVATIYKYDYTTNTPNNIEVHTGDSVEVSKLHSGCRFSLDDGRVAVLQSRFKRYILARFEDNGVVEKVPSDELVVAIDRQPGWGLPARGTVVEVLNGEHQGDLGIVTVPGTNSTHVVFTHGVHFVKYAAKNLKVVSGEITLA